MPASPASPPLSEQAEPDHPRSAEAGIARRSGARPTTLSSKPMSPAQQHPAGKRHEERHQDPICRRVPLSRIGSVAPARTCGVSRKAIAFRILPRAVDQQAEQQRGDIGQHQAGQYLVGVEARLEQRRDRGPGHATERAGAAHRRQEQAALAAPRPKRQAATGDRAEGQLPFGADVPHARPEAERQADERS